MNKKGYGLGWKTISFAHMLLFPTTSDLVPVDRHHMNRLYGTTTSPSSEKKYLQVEDVIRQEQLASNYANYPASWFAWLKWEQFRQATGASLSTNGCESHLLLSVYWY